MKLTRANCVLFQRLSRYEPGVSEQLKWTNRENKKRSQLTISPRWVIDRSRNLWHNETTVFSEKSPTPARCISVFLIHGGKSRIHSGKQHFQTRFYANRIDDGSVSRWVRWSTTPHSGRSNVCIHRKWDTFQQHRKYRSWNETERKLGK